MVTETASASHARSAIFQRLVTRPALPAAAPHEMMKTHKRPGPAMAAVPETMMDAGGLLRLSDFDKIADLGEGASGVVTKVRLRGSSAVFALKTAYYCADGAEDELEVEALRRLAAGSWSPHVVRCHAVFRDSADEPTMLLLEFMDAGSLGRVLCRRGGERGLPERALAEVAAQCLAGLAHLHSRDVAHLDLKPDNLLASARGDVKIGDFSVSRIFVGGAGEGRRVPFSVGAAAYLSPERFQPDAHAGPRGACAADVWALGVTVLELFLGRCPILPAGERSSWMKLMEAICNGEPPSVPAGAAASADLREFVASCLHKDPRQRATVAQLLAHPFVALRDPVACRRELRKIIVETM
ncbi:mitogen-activated protein kinase kinase 9-like [Oryza brachyantha]|uniref:mitogen-activated protein kinase kinase 9-like n=1 Tax=Oryza brachyantha TaxID=4533 RepID=UPI001ADBCC6F|nr:mitogen-activated protein kinase kinase 9-like [Oryza brachyantha]